MDLTTLKNKFNSTCKIDYTRKCCLTGKYDACQVIPYGRKCYIWFTYIKFEPACVVLELGPKGALENLKVTKYRFHESLCCGVGTLLYGTLKNENTVVVEDIYYFEDENVQKKVYGEKLKLFKLLFTKRLKMSPLNDYNIILALIKHTYEEVLESVNKLDYDIYGLRYFAMNATNTRVELSKHNVNLVKKTAYFYVKYSGKSELYELYSEDNGEKKIYDNACVNEITVSTKLKEMFKDHKDEMLLVSCVYNKQTKSWIPFKQQKKGRVFAAHVLRQMTTNSQKYK